jgi:hypothetical protein
MRSFIVVIDLDAQQGIAERADSLQSGHGFIVQRTLLFRRIDGIGNL